MQRERLRGMLPDRRRRELKTDKQAGKSVTYIQSDRRRAIQMSNRDRKTDK